MMSKNVAIPSNLASYFKLVEDMLAELYVGTIWKQEMTSVTQEALGGLAKAYQGFPTENRQHTVDWLNGLLPPLGQNDPLRAYILSYIFHLTRNSPVLDRILDIGLAGHLNLEEQHYLYWQLGRAFFMNSALISTEQRIRLRRIHYNIVEACRQALNLPSRDPHKPINENLVMVITNQFLKVSHAPTADAIDYCLILKQALYKDVLLVHTADHARVGLFPYYDWYLSNYLEEYNDKGTLRHQDVVIPFTQIPHFMPHVETIQNILNDIDALRPGLILSLGGSNIIVDLASEFVRVASIPFGTDLPTAMGGLFVVPGPITPVIQGIVDHYEIPAARVMESRYHYGMPDRSNTVYTREEWQLQPDDFVIVMVGYRLAKEIDQQLLSDLNTLLEKTPRLRLLFMGVYDDYEAHIAPYTAIQKQAVNVGFQKDVLAIYELCNVYLNPRRSGGGSSGAYALGSGLPVICLSQGDVSNVVGNDRIFTDFAAVEQYILKCQVDPAFYAAEASNAKAIHATISDRKKWLTTIMHKAKMLPPGFKVTLKPQP